ncbi:MAG: PD-(D/E)XK nuclease family protein [Sulfurimonas sp.]|uniref:PD-(D/E)XK nuclease family protein n=1 Tax=Sulfurimonas sp. TaxID=2022749 RepID=UPI0025D079E5|nr:PD-(D/E)XK nuclease family protein [Sulfurimonas sp.]MCK9492148.1 PD-(D/E)XK nuclease family protein [Sulfurimonas sp.]
MQNKTIILPTARAIRHELLQIENQTLFLPNYISMSEFLSKLCIVKDMKMVDEDSRVLLLLEASDFSSFSALRIERNFFTFTKNSSYIFKFFQELSAEIYDIEDLDTSDIYAEYEEHISILQELYRRYEKLCQKRGILDRVFLPKLYEFNSSYASSHKEIELRAVGHITNFEFELLAKCCEYSNITIIFDATKFNSKMQERLALITEIEFEIGQRYKISLNTKQILQQDPITQNKNVNCESFTQRLLQVAFVKKKLYEFIKKGYKAKNIAIVLPDESMAKHLREFDKVGNFNFAMGEPFSSSLIHQKISASCVAIENRSQENFARLQRVGDEIYKALFSIYYKKTQELDCMELLNSFLELCEVTKEEKKIYSEQVYLLKNILPSMKGMSVKSLMSIFLQRLSSTALDDVRGGEITVMGLLETRAINFDAVIILDFSDANVPKRSDKDMFLNTNIREMAGLPTMNDRENLQKYYYEMLINSAKEVAISYVNSQESSPSRFLKHLGIREQSNFAEQDYAKILFEDIEEEADLQDGEIKLAYCFKDVTLSATKLKAFLICKRRYYYKYIKAIKNHEIPKDMPAEHEIGTAVHEALKNLYTKKTSYTNLEELKKDLRSELDAVRGKSELDKYLIELQKRRLDEFCLLDLERFSQGYRVFACERELKTSYAGMKLMGTIDRIDIKDKTLEVLDYKTGSYPIFNAKNFSEATDFQLEFYYLLASGLGEVSSCGYYDLKNTKIANESFLQEKLEVLGSHIKDLLMIEDVNFELCEDTKHCQYCEYKIMCGRE